MIYFIVDGRLEYVKIGYTGSISSLPGRLRDLQVGNPYKLSVFGTMDGDVKAERKLHKLFAKYRTRGEWFVMDGALRAFIFDHFMDIDYSKPLTKESVEIINDSSLSSVIALKDRAVHE